MLGSILPLEAFVLAAFVMGINRLHAAFVAATVAVMLIVEALTRAPSALHGPRWSAWALSGAAIYVAALAPSYLSGRGVRYLWERITAGTASSSDRSASGGPAPSP